MVDKTKTEKTAFEGFLWRSLILSLLRCELSIILEQAQTFLKPCICKASKSKKKSKAERPRACSLDRCARLSQPNGVIVADMMANFILSRICDLVNYSLILFVSVSERINSNLRICYRNNKFSNSLILDLITTNALENIRLMFFEAAAVAKALGYRDASHMSLNLDADEKGLQIVETLGGTHSMSVINESGLYHAIMASRIEDAVKFRKWVTSEVLPQIRKTGGYMPINQEDDEKALLAKDVPRSQLAAHKNVRCEM